MRSALPVLLSGLALAIPFDVAAADLDGGDRGATATALMGGSRAPATALAQGRGRVGAPPQQRGRGRGRGKIKQNRGRGRGNAGRVLRGRSLVVPSRRAPRHRGVFAPRRAPRPAIVAPYRPPRYGAPYRNVRRTYLQRNGLLASVLYSGDWGGVHVEFGRPAPPAVYVEPAPAYIPPPVHLRRQRTIRIPPGHLPPPGLCRVWFPGRPPGHQPPPTYCGSAYRYAPAHAYIVYGG